MKIEMFSDFFYLYEYSRVIISINLAYWLAAETRRRMSVTARFAIVLLAASQNIWYNRNVEPEQFPGFNETDIDECDAFISYN